MSGSLQGRTLLSLSSVLLFAACASTQTSSQTSSQPMPASAPARGSAESASAGAFQRQHPYLASLIRATEVSNELTHDRVVAARGGGEQLDGQLQAQLVQDVLLAAESPRLAPSGEFAALAPPRVQAMLQRGQLLQRLIYDTYADPAVSNPKAEVEAAVDAYLADAELAFPAEPKGMEIMDGQTYSKAFREGYARLNGLMWAGHWLQLAAFEPLLLYRVAPEKQQAAVLAIAARYWSMFEAPPERFPVAMPMAPAIAPSLVRLHPRAAAIIDNMNMMHDVLSDLLVNASVTDKTAALEDAVRQFTDPKHLAVEWYEWNRMAILHGVGNQGGSATEFLPRPERTELMDHSGHTGHGGMMPPGMGM